VIQQVSLAIRALHAAIRSDLGAAVTGEYDSGITYTTRAAFAIFARRTPTPLPGTLTRRSPAVEFRWDILTVICDESPGIFRENQLSVNLNSKVSPTISLFGTYVLGRAETDAEGLGMFPANPYDLTGEYGPASYDIRHRLNVGGSVNTKWNVRLSVDRASIGRPFDITTGSDLYDLSLQCAPWYCDRSSKPGLIQTQYGLLDPNPSAGEKLIPRNFGRGPGQVSVNLRIAKIFGFGAERKPSKGGGIFAPPAERRYNVTVGLGIRNLLNHRNQGAIIGTSRRHYSGRRINCWRC
jgi:hypothetical protein